MSESEYFEAILGLVEAYNSIFNFWLTVTFAFLVAFFFVSQKLSRNLRAILIGLYAIEAVILALRYYSVVAGAATMVTRMNEAGYEYIPELFPGQGYVTLGGTLFLIIVGSIVATAFCITYSRSNK